MTRGHVDDITRGHDPRPDRGNATRYLEDTEFERHARIGHVEDFEVPARLGTGRQYVRDRALDGDMGSEESRGDMPDEGRSVRVRNIYHLEPARVLSDVGEIAGERTPFDELGVGHIPRRNGTPGVVTSMI